MIGIGPYLVALGFIMIAWFLGSILEERTARAIVAFVLPIGFYLVIKAFFEIV